MSSWPKPHTAIHLLFSGDERFNIKVSVMIQNETTKEEQNDTSTNKTKWAMTQYHRDCKDRNNIIKHSNKVCISIQATTSTIHTHSQVSETALENIKTVIYHISSPHSNTLRRQSNYIE